MALTTKFTLALAAGSLALTTACTDPGMLGGPNDPDKNTKQGALLGAGLGAAIGAISAGSGNRGKGAAIGAVVGAAGGVVAGSILDRQERDLRQSVGNSVQITNTGDRLIVTLPQDILFATDSATLRPDLVSDLRAVAGHLNNYPNSAGPYRQHWRCCLQPESVEPASRIRGAGAHQPGRFRRAGAVDRSRRKPAGGVEPHTGRPPEEPARGNRDPAKRLIFKVERRKFHERPGQISGAFMHARTGRARLAGLS